MPEPDDLFRQDLPPDLFKSDVKPAVKAEPAKTDDYVPFPQSHPLLNRFLFGPSQSDAPKGMENVPVRTGMEQGRSVLPQIPYNPQGDVVLENLKGLYNKFVTPLGTPSGFMGAANIGDSPEGEIPKSEVPPVTTPQTDIELPSEAPKQQVPQATQALEKAQPDALQKLNNAITKAKPAQEEQAAINTAERAKRASAIASVNTPGEAGMQEKIAAMGGEYPKTGIAPLRPQLSQPDVDNLMDIINDHPALDNFEKVRTGVALTKVLDGQTPQENEIDLLQKAFGTDLGDKLRTMNPSLGRKVDELVNLPKSLVTGVFHFSAPLRQGAQMIHQPAFWTSLDDMFKSYGSEDAYKAVMDLIREDPNFEAGQQAGLSLTDIGAGLNNREDMIRSNLAEKIPIVGRAYRASNRAFTAYLNKLRQDVFSSMISDASNVAKLKGDPMLDPANNQVLSREIASYINSATGRGSLGSAEKYAGALNAVLFSPRLQAGRLQSINTALNPFTGGSSFVRKEALKGLMSLGGLGLTTVGLAKLAGGDVNLDPTNPDFAKARFGDARIDPWAGDQQYGVLAAKLLSGHYTSSSSGKTQTIGQGYNAKTYGGVIGDFAANKLSPAAKFAYDLLTSKNIHGQPTFQLGPHGSDPGEVARIMAPILAQNLYSLAKDNPGLIPTSAIIPLSTLGMGSETYGR